MSPLKNCTLAFALASAGALSTAAAPALDFTFSPETSKVAISGVTPGGFAAVLGVSRIYHDFLTTLVRSPKVLSDDDADGRVELDAEVTPNSVWIAVDLTTGATVAVAPPGGEVHDGAELQPVVEVQSSTSLRRLRAESKSLDLLVVRFGRGVWFGIVCDGAAGDADETQDGLLRVDRSAFRRLAGPDDAPGSMTSSDLVVAVDPDTLRVFSKRIGQLPVEGVQ
jgi:hypothetical protein